MRRLLFIVLACGLLFIACFAVQAGEWSGSIAAELRYFPRDPLSPDAFEHTNLALSFEPEYVHQWDDGRQQFVFVPYLLLDQHDSKRTHFDIRELTWLKASEDWELRVGVRKVFWGVTEFNHLVDIINQDDEVVNIDAEDKLGQPMVNYALIGDWGTLDFFVLPGFRERTFPGKDGRPRGELYVDTNQADYESGARDKHIDYALRWSKTIDDWDVALSYFYGTNRDPQFRIGSKNGEPVLVPVYNIIQQGGLELQYTSEEWLWKLEAIARSGRNEKDFFSATGGFEYTFVGIFDTAADLGIIGEYTLDDRRNNSPTPFENDIALGARLALNDAQSSELLAGIVFDLDSSAKFYSLEASRRIGDNWKLNLEARFNSHIPEDDPSFAFRDEDFVQLQLEWFF